MPFDYDDPYVTVECKIVRATEKAVQIEDGGGDTHWLPRSCLHGGDDGLVDGSIGDDVQLKVRRWIAEREGII